MALALSRYAGVFNDIHRHFAFAHWPNRATHFPVCLFTFSLADDYINISPIEAAIPSVRKTQFSIGSSLCSLPLSVPSRSVCARSLGFRLAAAANGTLPSAGVRCVSLKVIKAEPPSTLGHDERNMEKGRQMSPHLTIYAVQLTSMLSISHRFTGERFYFIWVRRQQRKITV